MHRRADPISLLADGKAVSVHASFLPAVAKPAGGGASAGGAAAADKPGPLPGVALPGMAGGAAGQLASSLCDRCAMWWLMRLLSLHCALCPSLAITGLSAARARMNNAKDLFKSLRG